MVDMTKCGIIGCGFVGTSIAFSLLQSGLFQEIVLLDVNNDKAQGEAMDLSHGLSFSDPMDIYAGDYCDLEDTGIIIITAGAGQKPGETRLDLVHKNVEIFKKIIPQITKYNKEAILLVVSNPVDILTYVTLQLSGYPEHRVIGSGTVLDSGRLKYMIGKQLAIDPRSVHSFVIGEHGDSELVAWSCTNISGVPFETMCHLRSNRSPEPNYRDDLEEDVKQSAYEIIEKKGFTCYGVAIAVKRICEGIVGDEHCILSVSSILHGEYGMDEICIGVPTVLGATGVEDIITLDLSEDEQKDLQESVTELKEVIAGLDL
ncbi:MAG: L-lactate dehydrogenase [Lachnospiraceae bacterium]|nr:L-lactate dehydrogenase [Lachnospiraceae bacterium]